MFESNVWAVMRSLNGSKQIVFALRNKHELGKS